MPRLYAPLRAIVGCCAVGLGCATRSPHSSVPSSLVPSWLASPTAIHLPARLCQPIEAHMLFFKRLPPINAIPLSARGNPTGFAPRASSLRVNGSRPRSRPSSRRTSQASPGRTNAPQSLPSSDGARQPAFLPDPPSGCRWSGKRRFTAPPQVRTRTHSITFVYMHAAAARWIHLLG